MTLSRNKQTTPIYDSEKLKSPAVEEFWNIIQYRHLIWQLTRRDILTRYKRSLLGVAWTLLNPLGMMIVMAIVFSNLFGREDSYLVYLLSGLVLWEFFSQSTNSIMRSLNWGSSLMEKVFVPPAAFSLSSIWTALINLLISIVPLFIIMLFEGIPIQASVLFIPVALLFITLFSLGFGMLLSTWSVYFPDVLEMYQVVLRAWLYLTPIIYPESFLPENILKLIKLFNPLYHLLVLFRGPIYDGVVPSLSEIITGFLISSIVFLLGWFVFTRRSDEFAYRL